MIPPTPNPLDKPLVVVVVAAVEVVDWAKVVLDDADTRTEKDCAWRLYKVNVSGLVPMDHAKTVNKMAESLTGWNIDYYINMCLLICVL